MTESMRLHSVESEQSVLGALLIDPESADRLGALRPEHFYVESHRQIMTEIMAMIASSREVDAVTVAEELADKGLSEKTGGLAYLGELVANTPSARSIGRYAETVVGKALERQLLEAAESIRDTVGGVGTSAEKIATAQSAVMGISEAVATRQPKMLSEVLNTAADILTQRSEGKVPSLSTGFDDLDDKLGGGLRPGNVVIIAGRPSMGKTTLAVNIAHRVSERDKPVLLLSMEMSEQEIADRLISQFGSVYLSDVMSGKLSGESGSAILSALSKLRRQPLVIDDQGGLNLFDVTSKARSVKRKHGLSLLVLDYLQLMSGSGDARENRNNQLEQITRGLKSLAKELGIPIIVLSQLSRECDKRPNKRPMMSDLRDSGAIEQDADVIMFVYRDEVYHPESPDKGTGEIIIGKNRQGEIGMVRLCFQGYFTRFMNLAHDWAPAAVSAPMKTRRTGDDY